MRNDQDSRELTTIFNTVDQFNFNLKNQLPSKLDKGSASRTLNSWAKGFLVDGTGAVWIMESMLPEIWRTDAVTASYFADGIEPQYKRSFNGEACIKFSAVMFRLDEIISTPITNKRRSYLRVSRQIGDAVYDSDSVEVIRLHHTEYVQEIKTKLKGQRIKEYFLTCDELTGEPLLVNAEFHHILRQSTYPNLIGYIWNGIVINKSTHMLITNSKIKDEYDLEDICLRNTWNTNWIDSFTQSRKMINNPPIF